RELFEMTKIGIYLMTNIVITSLPLKVSEFFMTALNPAMKKRRRVANYNADAYQTCDWDEDETKNLVLRLKKAREEHKATGGFNVFVDGKERRTPANETAAPSLALRSAPAS